MIFRRILICFFICSSIACSKSSVDPDSIVGKWRLIYTESEVKYLGQLLSSERDMNPKGDYIEFHSNGRITIWSFSEFFEGHYQVVDGRLFIAGNSDVDFPQAGFGIERNGNSMFLIEDDNDDLYDDGWDIYARTYLER